MCWQLGWHTVGSDEAAAQQRFARYDVNASFGRPQSVGRRCSPRSKDACRTLETWIGLLHLESQEGTMERLPGKSCATCCTIFSIFCILILVLPFAALHLALLFVIDLLFDLQVACGLLLKNKNPYIAGHSFVEVSCDFTLVAVENCCSLQRSLPTHLPRRINIRPISIPPFVSKRLQSTVQ